MRARVVSDQLRCAHCDEIGIARIRDLYADMNAGHCVENVVDGIFGVARRQVAGHAEREFGFGNRHAIGAERYNRSIAKDSARKDASCQRSVDVDVILARETGGGDFPAE